MRVFAVISWGCAATGWAARVLNSHPDVLCMHAANTYWHRFGASDSEKLDGVPYLRVVMTMANGYQAAGDVHGISRDQVPAIQEAFGQYFECAVLVREPIARVQSQMALFDSFRRFPAWDLDYAKDLIDRCGLSLPSEDSECLMFVHAANMLNAILEEQALGPVFRAERITSSAEDLAEFINFLTAGDVTLEHDWLEQVVHQPRLNQHVQDTRPELEPWQIDVLRKVVQPEAWEAYRKLGYSDSLPSALAAGR